MTDILLLAHTPLASALAAVAAHAFPECGAQLRALDIGADMGVDQVEALLRRTIATMHSDAILILVDVAGATPCNAAQRLSGRPGLALVAGVNVAMLWRTLCYRSETPEALARRAFEGGVTGVQLLIRPPRLDQPPAAAFDDQDPNSNQ